VRKRGYTYKEGTRNLINESNSSEEEQDGEKVDRVGTEDLLDE
jgi:hypothetical protein